MENFASFSDQLAYGYWQGTQSSRYAYVFEETFDIDRQYINKGLSAISDSWDSSTGTFKEISETSWMTTLSVKYEIKDLELSDEDAEFAENLAEQYGFDAETVKQIMVLKQGIDSQFSDYTQQERDYIFLRLIGAVSYNSWVWKNTASDLGGLF